jgi:hypothetical protein
MRAGYMSMMVRNDLNPNFLELKEFMEW